MNKVGGCSFLSPNIQMHARCAVLHSLRWAIISNEAKYVQQIYFVTGHHATACLQLNA